MSLFSDFEQPAKMMTTVIRTTGLDQSLANDEWTERRLKIRGRVMIKEETA